MESHSACNIAFYIRQSRSKEKTTRYSVVLKLASNKDLNANLKVISEICELGISLNFYMARHTFATTIALLNGVPVTSIKEMMGHERIESTMIYIKIHAASVAQHMKKVKKMIERKT